MKNNRNVVPQPSRAPKIPMVYLKNFRPTKDIRIPKTIRTGPARETFPKSTLNHDMAEKIGHPVAELTATLISQ